MNLNPVASFIVAIAGAGLFNVLLELYKARRAAKKEDATEPFVRENMALGNVEKAVAIQLQIIDQQHKHIAFLEKQVEELRSRIEQLEHHNDQQG